MANTSLIQAIMAALPPTNGPTLPPASLPNVPLISPGQPNVPEYGGPSQVTEPPTAPGDFQRFLSAYLSMAGPAPQAPAPLSRGQRIGNALSGFSAGVSGNGPQFLAQLNEPQRRFEAQTADYNQRRSELGMRAYEAAQRDIEKRTARAQELADRQHLEEYQRETRRLNLYDEASQEKVRQAFAIEQEARRQRFEVAKEAERRRLQQEDDARGIAGRLGSGPGAAPPHIAKELGRFYANITNTLSPSAAKWVNAQARRADLLARPATGGGPAASRRETLDLQRRMSQAATGIAAMEKLARSAMEADESKRPPILGQMRAMAATLGAQFGGLVEVGESGGWPYVRLRLRGSGGSGQQQPQPQGKTISRAEMQALGVTEQQAKSEGYTITP